VRPLHQFLQLGQERVDNTGTPGWRPTRNPALLAARAIPRDGVMRTARQLGGIAQRPGQVECSKNFHDFLGRLHVSPPRGQLGKRLVPLSQAGEKAPAGDAGGNGQTCRALLMTASGQIRGHLRAVSRVRRHLSNGRSEIRAEPPRLPAKLVHNYVTWDKPEGLRSPGARMPCALTVSTLVRTANRSEDKHPAVPPSVSGQSTAPPCVAGPGRARR
jgi:hypothetical protein